eukprot:2773446-Heterocapsa_arctica.AAC.1
MDNKRIKGQVQPATAKRTSDRGWGTSRDQKGDRKTPTSGAHTHRFGRFGRRGTHSTNQDQGVEVAVE